MLKEKDSRLEAALPWLPVPPGLPAVPCMPCCSARPATEADFGKPLSWDPIVAQGVDGSDQMVNSSFGLRDFSMPRALLGRAAGTGWASAAAGRQAVCGW